jgi:hypothetical protein
MYLPIFDRLHIILRILIWGSMVLAQHIVPLLVRVSLFRNTDLNLYPDPTDKTVTHETLTRLFHDFSVSIILNILYQSFSTIYINHSQQRQN